MSLVLVLAVAGSARAQSGYLKLGDIPGEAAGEGYKDWIDLISVSQLHPGVQSIRVMKRMDKSTPLIAQALAKETRFPKAMLALPEGGSSQKYMEVGPSLADDALPGLGAGDQHTASGLVPLKEGTWTLYVNVDDDLVVAEGDEQNNLRRVRVRVEGSCGPDVTPGKPDAVRIESPTGGFR